jgi:hypothetical protein
MKEFNVGDVVWWAKCGSSTMKEDCPVCFTKRKVVVILGNDEQVQVACDYCGKGFEGPRGFVQEQYKWHTEVRPVVIEAKSVSENGDGKKIEYRGDHYSLDDTNIFTTREEAETRAQELISKHEIEEAKTLATRKEHNVKSYAWHVGYHKRCASKARNDLAFHESKVVAMAKRAK